MPEAISTRRCAFEVIYNGTDVSADVAKDLESFSWTGRADGASDSISITLCAKGDKPESYDPGPWLKSWFPQADDTLEAKLRVTDWREPGDNGVLNLGKFTLDAPRGSLLPTTLSLQGVSQPSSKAFVETKRTQNWQNVTLEKIAGDMAQRSGLTLAYDGPSIQIQVKEQKKTTDSAFLKGLCDTYGFCLKVYADRLVAYDLKTRKQAASAASFVRGDFEKFDFQKMQRGTYTGAKLVHADAQQEEIIDFSLGGGERILTINQKADNRADAERICRGKINKENHKATTINFALSILDCRIVDGVCFDVSGTGTEHLDGKYFVDSVTVNGSKMSGTASRVEEMF